MKSVLRVMGVSLEVEGGFLVLDTHFMFSQRSKQRPECLDEFGFRLIGQL